jgi:hypothetical protein
MPEMPARANARSTLETFDRIHPDDRGSLGWLSDEGNRALRHLHSNGACRDLGPAIFFPEKGQ